jgi:hypothetical protein
MVTPATDRQVCWNILAIRAVLKGQRAIAMKWTTMGRAATLFAGAAVLALLAGCRIHVDKAANGVEKTVQVDTPFGGVHVNTDQVSAADLGLPIYPGAEAVSQDGKHKSADVHMGFGEWELRVKAASYSTSDSEDKVTDFYRKALGRYGQVIACDNNTAVGTPTTTSEGLSCSEDGHANVNINTDGGNYGYQSGHKGYQLKAGSKRHQHIVGFEGSHPGETRFELVALDLPADGSSRSSN